MIPLLAVSGLYWHLPVLLIAFSLVYSGTRHDRWDRILWEAAGWVVRISGFLGMIGVGLWVVSNNRAYWPYLAAVGAVLFVLYMWISYRVRSRQAASEPGQ